ncbi:hybrid sensor histidine kinase/response regulator [Dinoroseobacter sp. S76]|uniref:hybrid sensor histidine kinase/response regulator n=1 Tax=Dinoroseobacter sp. S76 TaxID=3415124 RepID=UPI003C7A4673
MRVPDPSFRQTRPLWIAAAALALISVTVGLGVTLGLQTRTQFREISASWDSYTVSAERKGTLISEIRGYLGYGGIIHNFKNYVLRQEDVYLQATTAQIAQFRETIAEYRTLALQPSEETALSAIADTIRTYEQTLPQAQTAARFGWPPARTDALVRVDDSEALAALARLEEVWLDAQEVSTQRILASVTEGNRLIWIGFWSIAALVLAALAIGWLLYLMFRDLNAANARLARELAERKLLEQAQARLTTIVEQSPTTILMTDTKGQIEYANAKFEALTGWSREEIRGKTPAFLQSGDTEDHAYAEIRETLGRGEIWRGVFRNLRKDGSSYWAETTLLPLLDAQGAVQNFAGLGEDITEARRARDHVVRAQKLEAVGQLAGGVAHDFNNILTTIVGASHLAALDAPEGSDLAQEIDQIEIAARRAQSLVRELLTFARREPGKRQPVLLHEIVSEVLMLLRASIPPMVELRYTPDDTPLAVLGDPTHLHQIIMNLCRNGAEAMNGAAGVVEVTISADAPPEDMARDRAEWVRLQVADNGPGMQPQTLKHLFDPFFTTKPLGKGSGLGLAVVFGLVEDMEGVITVDSAPGAGARFDIYLPRANDVAVAQADAERDLPRGSERVLLVDDEAEVAGTLRRLLQRLGYRVDAFTAPRQALSAFTAAQEAYDLVISDMVMPDMSGLELAAAIRDLRPGLPVIFCSGYPPRLIDLPGEAPKILAKPVDPVLFARQVRTAIDYGKIETP